MISSLWASSPISKLNASSYYDNGILDDFDNRLELSVLHKHLRKYNHKITCLDLAAGTGRFADAILPYASKLDLVDLDPNHIAKMKSRFSSPNVNFYEQDAVDFIYNSAGSYDLIVISGLLLFFEDELAAKVIEQARNLLNPKGIVLVRDFISKNQSLTTDFVLSPGTKLYYRPIDFYKNHVARDFVVCRPHHRFAKLEDAIFKVLGYRIYQAICLIFYNKFSWYRMPWYNSMFIINKD
jgi:SAM-dependent methyltransferase